MSYSLHAAALLTAYVQQNCKDSTGKGVRNLREADAIAARLINKLVHNPIVQEVGQEVLDNLRYTNTDEEEVEP